VVGLYCFVSLVLWVFVGDLVVFMVDGKLFGVWLMLIWYISVFVWGVEVGVLFVFGDLYGNIFVYFVLWVSCLGYSGIWFYDSVIG